MWNEPHNQAPWQTDRHSCPPELPSRPGDTCAEATDGEAAITLGSSVLPQCGRRLPPAAPQEPAGRPLKRASIKGLESACPPPRTPWGPQRPVEQNPELILLVTPTPQGAHTVICKARGWGSHVECCPMKAVLEPFRPQFPHRPVDRNPCQLTSGLGKALDKQECSASLHSWEGWPPCKGLLGQKARAGHPAPR